MVACWALVPLGASGQAQSNPAAVDLAAAQSLLAQGKAQAAFDLLAGFEDELAGDLQFDYLLARSALESGQPSLASFIYERILAIEPNYVGVRLENGRAYLELENFARAKQEFELVLGFENLPPDLRATAEQYAEIAQAGLTPKRTFFNAFAEYGFGLDDNVNSALSTNVGNFSITWGMNCKNGSGVWTRRAASSTVAPHGNGQNHPRARAQRR